MNRDYAATLAIAEQAADWLERLPTASTDEREEFVAWLRASPAHVRELLLAVRCAERLRHLDPKRLFDAEAFVARAMGRVTPLTKGAAIQRFTKSGGGHAVTLVRGGIRNLGSWRATAVVSFVALFSLIAVTIYAVSDRTISTTAGQWHTTQLPDGTILRAGPRTKATLDFTEHRRVVHLVHGELMLHVAKDRARPFSVETDLATARAVGTAFAVRRMERDLVSITVKEGVVAVNRGSPSKGAYRASTTTGESIAVNAGERVQVTSESVPLTVVPVNLEKELAWTTGQLVFTTETIADAVREFNLRNDVQIKILSPELETRPIRGVMHVDDPESLAGFLEKSGVVSLVNDRRGTLVLVPLPTEETELTEP